MGTWQGRGMKSNLVIFAFYPPIMIPSIIIFVFIIGYTLIVLEKNIRIKQDCQNTLIQIYAQNKQWDLLKQMESTFSDKSKLAGICNDLAWSMQEKNSDLDKAEELSAWAVETAKKEISAPAGPKPDEITTKEWASQRESSYAMYADTYAMILYKPGNYSKGFSYTEEAAITINKGQDADQNANWSLLAEKVLPDPKYKVQLEQFVKDGKATSSVNDALKRLYTEEKKTDASFNEYISGLENELRLKMAEEIRKGEGLSVEGDDGALQILISALAAGKCRTIIRVNFNHF